MRKYYVIKQRMPSFVLIEAASLAEARRLAKSTFKDEQVHQVGRATAGDIAFVEWIDEKERADAQRRDAGEQGLARSGEGSEHTGEEPVVRTVLDGHNGRCVP